MLIRKGYKYRMVPSSEQQKLLFVYAGHSRFVWNYFLGMNRRRLEAGQRILWYAEMCFFLALIKKSEEYAWLNDAPSQSLQQTLKDLDRAFRDAFDRQQPNKRLPVFKKKGKALDAFRFPQGFKLDTGSPRHIILPKLGRVKFRKSRDWIGTVKNVTVSRRGAHWYLSLQSEYEIPEPVNACASTIGGDLGVARFLTLSDGTVFPSLRPLKALAHRIKFLQRRLAKKVRFSSNWKKLNRKIALLNERVADLRNNFLHQISTIIAKNHGTVILEDLKVKNMSASAKGDRENPGSQVRQKAGLNRSILDQGWGRFVELLRYKLEELGGRLLLVDPKYSSQACPLCGHTHRENRPTQARFQCRQCGFALNADEVGAINVLMRGLVVVGLSEEEAVDFVIQQTALGHRAVLPAEDRGFALPDEAGTVGGDRLISINTTTEALCPA